jgi:26S proteasome regulatory subunit N5
MRWPGIEGLYGPTLRATPVFAPDTTLGTKTSSRTDEVKPEGVSKPGDARWEDLHKRVVEHVSLFRNQFGTY